MVERLEPTVRYVAVDGAVSRIEPGTDEQLVEMTKRYLAPEKVEPYLEFARREHGESVAVFLKPEPLAVFRPGVAGGATWLAPTAVPVALQARVHALGRPSVGAQPDEARRRNHSPVVARDRARSGLRYRGQRGIPRPPRLAGHRRGLCWSNR